MKKYTIINTNLHGFIVKQIEKQSIDPIVVVDVRRKGDVLCGSVSRLGKKISAILKLFAFILDPDRCLIISHPFNPWNSLFVWFSKQVEIYDDGIAYYNNTSIPGGWKGRLYLRLSSKLNKTKYEGGIGYTDYLMSSLAVVYYSLFPVFFQDREGPEIRKIYLPQYDVKSKTDVVVVLDSPDDKWAECLVSRMSRLLSFVSSIYPSAEFYYKPHPHKESNLSKYLSQMSWVRRYDLGAEDLLFEKNVVCVISFCSSAGFLFKLINRDCDVFCFEAPKSSGLDKLSKMLGVEVIYLGDS